MSATRKKRSKIWLMPEEELRKLVASSDSYRSVLRACGLPDRGKNHDTLKARLVSIDCDVSHIKNKPKWAKAHSVTRVPLEKHLVENSPYRTKGSDLKRRILKAGLKKDLCEICGMGPVWQEKPISLQLHHINGKPNDNRIENLQILCPNCHTQTDSFAGKRSKRRPPTPAEINPNRRHAPRYGARKVIRPSKEVLEMEVREIPMVQLGKKYGVSNVAVKKWCKSYGIAL